MTDNNRKRKSQDAHISRDGQPMALIQQQQRQIMVFQPQNTMPSPQQQQNIAFQPQLTMPVTPHFRCGPRHGSVDPYGFPHQQLPTAGQDLQFQGAFLQHDMHADCHSAANCPREALRKEYHEELVKTRNAMEKLLEEKRHMSQPEPSHNKAEFDRLLARIDKQTAEIAKLKADMAKRDAASKGERKMPGNRILRRNGTRHDGNQATASLATASSPLALTPTSSSSNISVDPHFSTNGTSQQSGGAGHTDQEVAIVVAGAVADYSSMNPNSLALHGGLQSSVPVTGNAVFSENLAWTNALAQTQQELYPASFGSGGGLHNLVSYTGHSLLRDNANWMGAVGQMQPSVMQPSVMQQPNYTTAPAIPNTVIDLTGPDMYLAQSALDVNHMSISAGRVALTGQLTGYVSMNSADTWIDGGEMQPNMVQSNMVQQNMQQRNMQQQSSNMPAPVIPTLHAVPTLDPTQMEQYFPAQPAVNLNSMLAVDGLAFANNWQDDDFVDYNGEIE